MSQPLGVEAQQEFLENKLNNLTDAEESRLEDICFEQNEDQMILDDDMPDFFDSWLEQLTYSELVDYLDIEHKIDFENSGAGNGDPNNER